MRYKLHELKRRSALKDRFVILCRPDSASVWVPFNDNGIVRIHTEEAGKARMKELRALEPKTRKSKYKPWHSPAVIPGGFYP